MCAKLRLSECNDACIDSCVPSLASDQRSSGRAGAVSQLSAAKVTQNHETKEERVKNPSKVLSSHILQIAPPPSLAVRPIYFRHESSEGVGTANDEAPTVGPGQRDGVLVAVGQHPLPLGLAKHFPTDLRVTNKTFSMNHPNSDKSFVPLQPLT